MERLTSEVGRIIRNMQMAEKFLGHSEKASERCENCPRKASPRPLSDFLPPRFLDWCFQNHVRIKAVSSLDNEMR